MDILQCQKMYVSFYLTQLFLILLGFIDSSKSVIKATNLFFKKRKKPANAILCILSGSSWTSDLTDELAFQCHNLYCSNNSFPISLFV